MNLERFLERYRDNDVRIEVYGKNNLPFSSCPANLHLATSKNLLKKKVLYDGLDQNCEIVVVINKKVKICK